MLLSDIGTIGWGGNGGFHAVNLALQFRVKKIILIGFDMRIDLGIHWHGPNNGIKGLYDPTPGNVTRWRRVLDDAAPLISALGIPVINCSEVSTLNNYPKMSLERALEC